LRTHIIFGVVCAIEPVRDRLGVGELERLLGHVILEAVPGELKRHAPNSGLSFGDRRVQCRHDDGLLLSIQLPSKDIRGRYSLPVAKYHKAMPIAAKATAATQYHNQPFLRRGIAGNRSPSRRKKIVRGAGG